MIFELAQNKALWDDVCEKTERGSTVHRLPDFKVIPTPGPFHAWRKRLRRKMLWRKWFGYGRAAVSGLFVGTVGGIALGLALCGAATTLALALVRIHP